MRQNEYEITAFAEKIEALCQKSRANPSIEASDQEDSNPTIRKKVKGIHLTTIRFGLIKPKQKQAASCLLKRPIHRQIQLKQLEAITSHKKSPFEEEVTPVYKTANEANNCCWNQDLHLFHYMQLFTFHHMTKRQIACWKLPKAAIANGLLQQTKSLSDKKPGRQGHKYMRILIGSLKKKSREKELEKNLNEQIEFDKNQKARRNYADRPSIFS